MRLSVVISDLSKELGRRAGRSSVLDAANAFITPTEVYTTTDDEIDAIMADL